MELKAWIKGTLVTCPKSGFDLNEHKVSSRSDHLPIHPLSNPLILVNHLFFVFIQMSSILASVFHFYFLSSYLEVSCNNMSTTFIQYFINGSLSQLATKLSHH